MVSQKLSANRSSVVDSSSIRPEERRLSSVYSPLPSCWVRDSTLVGSASREAVFPFLVSGSTTITIYQKVGDDCGKCDLSVERAVNRHREVRVLVRPYGDLPGIAVDQQWCHWRWRHRAHSDGEILKYFVLSNHTDQKGVASLRPSVAERMDINLQGLSQIEERASSKPDRSRSSHFSKCSCCGRRELILNIYW
jgi:hypothetical protein